MKGFGTVSICAFAEVEDEKIVYLSRFPVSRMASKNKSVPFWRIGIDVYKMDNAINRPIKDLIDAISRLDVNNTINPDIGVI